MATVAVARLDPATAALMLSGMERFDPRGIADSGDVDRMTRDGHCFAVTHADSGAQAVYVLHVRNGVCWIDACHGSGPVDWTHTLLPAIESQAAHQREVGFQTARLGLVRKASDLGYEITGWIMRKKLHA